MENKKIFIFGGSGSLGIKLTEKYIKNNIIINYSRDEYKHWVNENQFNNKNLQNIIGNVRDKSKINISLIQNNPNIIIIASALKHIERCEYESYECIQTNIIGVQNILESIHNNLDKLTKLETVIFISTDKACNPINLYGLCKACCEKIMIEKSKKISAIKFISVRYGNVLNSKGSIIPFLKGLKSKKYLTITDNKMTRFIMTLEQSCNLIEYAINNGDSGDIIIPNLISMRIRDTFEIFSELYSKPIKVIGNRPGEKFYETLINKTESRMVAFKNHYYHLKPYYKNPINTDKYEEFNSNNCKILSKDELKNYLEKEELL